jgi:septum formation protein
MPLWLAGEPLVLASKSAIRHALLRDAGVPVEVQPADIDERAIEQRSAPRAAGELAALLAREKARTIAARLPGRLVLGADQTLALGERRFSKPGDRAGARAQLKALRGRTHELHTAVALMRESTVVFEHREVARLTMRAFSDSFLESYLEAVGAAVTGSVGGYQLERIGIQLFERIEGEHFVILGLPLVALLRYLRQAGWLAA